MKTNDVSTDLMEFMFAKLWLKRYLCFDGENKNKKIDNYQDALSIISTKALLTLISTLRFCKQLS